MCPTWAGVPLLGSCALPGQVCPSRAGVPGLPRAGLLGRCRPPGAGPPLRPVLSEAQPGRGSECRADIFLGGSGLFPEAFYGRK
ncbi:hypothetical protein Nmel_013760, partial [Mimus melanotis]